MQTVHIELHKSERMGNEVKKRSFVFNIEWQEVLKEYPPEVRLEVYDAIIEYVASGTLSELKPLSKMAFSFIKKEIDYNNDRYDEIVSKRKEAGRKAMESRWGKSLTDDNKHNTCNQMLADDNKHSICKQKVTTVTDNVNDNVNVNEDVFSSRTREAVAEVSEEEKRNFFEIFFFRNFQDPSREAERFIAWNGKQGKHPTKYDAELWNPEVKEKRFSEGFIKAWKALYTTAKFSGPDGEEAAFLMLDSRLSMKAINGKWQLQCPEKVAAWLNDNQETAVEMLKPALRGYPLGIKTYRT